MATYKTGWMKKLIDGVATKVFAISHVKAIFYDYANSKTLKTKLDEMDTSISGKAESTHYHNEIKFQIGNDSYLTLGISFPMYYSLTPDGDNYMTLGYSSRRWSQLYAGTTTIATSDRNCKKDIKNLLDDERFILLFKKLVPVSFLFTDGTSGRTHVGFIAQDVEDSMLEVGLTDLDFAGLCKDVKIKYTGEDDENGNPIFEKDLDENGNEQYVYALRYSEFIAINTMMIQKLDNRVQELEENMTKVFEHLNLE